MITLNRFRRIEAILRQNGYGQMIDWSERIQPPTSAEEFAEEAIYVICNSGMAVTVGTYLAQRCMAALSEGRSATTALGHPGKGPAIDLIWAKRCVLFADYLEADDKLDYLVKLPWIGPVTRYHLAKNLGADEAKPDVHLERLARHDRTSVRTLCRRLARLTGYRVATIDSVLWRACADGVLRSRIYESAGWKAAFQPRAYDVERYEIEITPDATALESQPADTD